MFYFTPDQIVALMDAYNEHMQEMLDRDVVTEPVLALLFSKFATKVEDIINRNTKGLCLDCKEEQSLRVH